MSGGIFHYMKGLTYSTAPANTLLNEVFCYFVHHLPKFQNMHPYRITSATDIPALVGTTYPALTGPPAVPETYLFSKVDIRHRRLVYDIVGRYTIS